MAADLLARYRHVCFDLDGTLVHTVAPYRQRVVRQVVAQLGGPPLSDEDVDRFWFETERTALVATVIGLDPQRFWGVWRELDRPEERARHTFAYPDAAPALRRLKAVGKLTSVVTGSPAPVAALELQKLGDVPLDYFLPIDYSRFREKPDPASFFFVAAELGVTPAETVHIGNSDEDAAYAAAAGVDFVYLERRSHLFASRDRALATIHSLVELFTL